MTVIARDEWPKRLYPHGGGREWSTSNHGDRWKDDAAVEVVPASQLRGAVEIIRALVAANYLPDDPDVADDVRALLAAEMLDQLRSILTEGQ